MWLRRLCSAPPKPPSVLFFGSDEFSLATLRRLVDTSKEGRLGEVGVVCPADPRRGKKGAVLQFAKKAGIARFEVPLGAKSLKNWMPREMSEMGFDVGVVASFGHFVPAHMIEMLPRPPTRSRLVITVVAVTTAPLCQGRHQCAPIAPAELQRPEHTLKQHPLLSSFGGWVNGDDC
jgi:hypothetical protein